MPTARLVHLATHGLLEYGSQSDAGSLQGLGIPGTIALTPSGKDDGLLTASEIINLHLQADPGLYPCLRVKSINFIANSFFSHLGGMAAGVVSFMRVSLP